MFIELRNNAVVNTDNIKHFTHERCVYTDGTYVSLDEEMYSRLYDALVPKAKQVRKNEPNEEALDLFNQLHRLTGGKNKAVFTLDREKRLTALLNKHRMTPELLIKSATNIGKDSYLQGENDAKKRWGDIDYLLRPDKAAKWSEDQQEKKRGMFQ